MNKKQVYIGKAIEKLKAAENELKQALLEYCGNTAMETDLKLCLMKIMDAQLMVEMAAKRSMRE